MSALKTLALGLAAALIALPTAISAQMQPLPRLAIPQDRFLGPNFWTDPVPATYTIEVVGTGLCLNRTTPENIFQVPYIRLRACNAANFDQNFELSPAAVEAPPIPATTNVRWRVNNRGVCAGTARNVVFGAPRVDFNPCGMPAFTGGNTAFRGDADQHVIMVRARIGQYSFRMADGRCWTVGGAVQDGAQLQMEPCDGRPGQLFQLTLQMGLAEPTNHAAAELFGWVNIGQVNNLENGPGAPDRFRRLGGLDLAGSDIESFFTDADLGMSCARQCARNSQCRSFTWVQPGAQHPDRAMCWLKNGLPAPTPNPDTISGILRP